MVQWLEQESIKKTSINPFPEKLKKTSLNHLEGDRSQNRQKQVRTPASSQFDKTSPLTLFPVNGNRFEVNTNSSLETLVKERETITPTFSPSEELAQSNSSHPNWENISSFTPEPPPQQKIRTQKKQPSQFKSKSILTKTDKNKHIRRRERPKSPLFSMLLPIIFLSAIRLLILGVGLGAIAGTILFQIDSSRGPLAEGNSLSTENHENELTTSDRDRKSTQSLVLKEEIVPLKEKLQALTAKYPKLQAGAFFVDIDNGSYIDIEGETAFSAASTIKIPVLVAFFEDVDAGKIHLDEMLSIQPEIIGGGSGDMQYQKPGKKFSALETATKMIVISDNTATNMLIARMGGAEALNQRFVNWGLKATVIHNLLPDLEGTNTTSPRDLGNLLAKIERGELISPRSRDRALAIMRETRTKTLLPQGLEKNALIAHKTGDIGSILGDAGLVDMPNGKRYIASVIVKRPHNDYTARTLIQEISKTAYQHFKWYKSTSFSEPVGQ